MHSLIKIATPVADSQVSTEKLYLLTRARFLFRDQELQYVALANYHLPDPPPSHNSGVRVMYTGSLPEREKLLVTFSLCGKLVGGMKQFFELLHDTNKIPDECREEKESGYHTIYHILFLRDALMSERNVVFPCLKYIYPHMWVYKLVSFDEDLEHDGPVAIAVL